VGNHRALTNFALDFLHGSGGAALREHHIEDRILDAEHSTSCS
jgi:hypothetical protein